MADYCFVYDSQRKVEFLSQEMKSMLYPLDQNNFYSPNCKIGNNSHTILIFQSLQN